MAERSSLRYDGHIFLRIPPRPRAEASDTRDGVKVLFSHNLPFSLAHGGQQTLIESLMRELKLLGVTVEPERWWDPDQSADIMHFVQRPHAGIVQLAKQKGRKTVMTENYDVVASEPAYRISGRACGTTIASALVPNFAHRLSFYRELDALVYVVPHEWEVVRRIYGLRARNAFIIPHGLEQDALHELSLPQPEEDYLVSVGTICSRKNSVKLAALARETQVPVVFVGKPLSDQDPYFQQFRTLIDDRFVRYVGFISEAEKYRILRGARGFVLLSTGESGCIAVYEAAAAGLPLLLSDLPWARLGYAQSSQMYFAPLRAGSQTRRSLGDFYASAHRGKAMTFPVGTWTDVAKMYVQVYTSLLTKAA